MNNYNDPQKPKNPNVKDDSISHKVGDTIERLGEKIIKAGAPKIGKAIYNAGDKLEHRNENKK
jgi:hypothetical protein